MRCVTRIGIAHMDVRPVRRPAREFIFRTRCFPDSSNHHSTNEQTMKSKQDIKREYKERKKPAGVFQVLVLVGREKALKRIDRLVGFLEKAPPTPS